MKEKVYLTADQYVVKCLEDKEQEIAKLNEKYDDLLKRFVTLQTENKKFERLKNWFSLEETSSGNGYQIAIKDDDDCYIGALAYCWDKRNPSQHFINLLGIFGLELPKEEEKENE